MATLAGFFDRLAIAKGAEQAPARWREQIDEFLIRAVPNEQVFLYTKRIDNPEVLREADPVASRACWKMMGSSITAVAIVVGLLAPSVYGLLAGYRLEALKQEKQRLEMTVSALQLEEAKLLSPARLEQLARVQRYVDPAPQQIVYLGGRPGKEVARAIRPGSRIANP